MSPATATDRLKNITWALLLCTLAAWWACIWLPGWRVWGLTHLLPLSFAERAAVSLLAILLCATTVWASERLWDRAGVGASGPTVKPLWYAIGAAICFALLADRTHFLGDSAALLHALPDAHLRGGFEFRLQTPVLSTIAAAWSGESGALRAYQVISVICGVLCVYLCAHYARRIFESGYRATAFLLGQLSAGAMLVYFGFVGEYVLLVLAVFAFLSAGAAFLRHRAGVWGALLSFLLAVAAHPLGWSLWPALCYLLLAQRQPRSARRRSTTWLLTVVCTAVTAGLLYFLIREFTESLHFRLALNPLYRDRLTVHGYTMLSVPHLLDVVNLLLLLLPALPLALVFLTSVRRERGESASVFLALAMWTTLLVAFTLDPPLGMARSWERFAFAGAPLAVWLYFRLLSVSSPRAITAAFFCISISASALLCRAWVQVRPEPAVRQAMNYFAIDPARSRTGVITVGQYLLDHNTTAIYGELEDFRRRNYPEEAMREELNPLFRDKKQREAAALCQEIIHRDPRYPSAWMFLGFILNNAGRFDSAAAYLNIANGLDPHNPAILNELGRACYFQGDHEGAVKLWNESLAEDSLQFVPQLALATYYRERGEKAEASRRLALAASRPNAPAEAQLELARDHAEAKRMSEARACFEAAVARGVDTAKAAQLLKDFPELGQGN